MVPSSLALCAGSFILGVTVVVAGLFMVAGKYGDRLVNGCLSILLIGFGVVMALSLLYLCYV